MAGLIHYYNRHKFHFLGVTWHEALGRVLTIMSCPGDWPDCRLSYPLAEPVPVPDGPVQLAMDVDHERLQFGYRAGNDWLPVGPVLDASLISDEAGRGEHGSFTGAFVGMAAFDTGGTARAADFSRFLYQPVTTDRLRSAGSGSR